MTGLLKKDFLLIFKNFSMAYIIGILPPVMVTLTNPAYALFTLSAIVVFLFAVQVSTTLELDEKVHWKKIVMSMPISAAEIAISKYILTFILASLAGVIVILITVIYTETMTVIYGLMAWLLILLYNSLVIPVTYRFGTSKSRYFVIFFVSIPIMLAYVFKIFDIQIGDLLLALDRRGLYFLSVCMGLLFVFISVYATVRTINKKDVMY